MAAVIVSALATVPGASAQSDCHSFARTDFERLYCQINAQSPGSVPGSLQEFRNNPPATQRLLLRRPAERMGLKLPATPVKPAAPQTEPTAASLEPAPPELQPTPARERQSAGFGSCRLQGPVIRCNRQVYRLLTNLNNNHLPSGALDAGNRLNLSEAPARGLADDWLQDSYVQYLEAMVSIGLAGETLSYTKFHHLYQEADAAGLPFTQRMADMYEYLKKDKQALAVRGGHADGLPGALTDCYQLSQRFIVCDNVRVNWIYEQR